MKEDMKYLTDKFQLRQFNIERMLEIIHNNQESTPGGVVFFGDSITEICDLDKYYPEIDHKYNCGLGGISSQMLLHFVAEGVLKFEPGKVVIMVGTNDLGKTVMTSPRQIALNIKEICEIIHYNLEECKIYVCSPIPCLEDKHSYKATHAGFRSNDMLKMIYNECVDQIRYDYVKHINIFDPMLLNGNPIRENYVDGLHVNDGGYRIFTSIIKEVLLNDN